MVSRQSFTLRGITVRKLLICAIALGGFAASAQAADLGVDSLKDPLPDTLSYKGVTVYGTIDVGYAYQTNGAPMSNYLYTGGMDINMYGAKQNRESISSLSDNALSQSTIGLKVEEAVGLGFVAIGKLETGFNPISGDLADACASLVANNNKATSAWTSGLDGSRCGQAFNGEAYAGLSNSSYGTLKIGRQNSLDLDLMAQYDPMGLSYAMSLIGFSGGAGPGVGTTETARWDNSIKYLYQYGPVHGAVMYADGGDGSSIQGDAIAGNLGATWHGLSVDAVYTKERGAVGMGTITAGAPTGNWLNATVTDNEAWTAATKYTLDVPALFGSYGGGFKDSCGMKDECPGAKLTFFAGYQHTDMTNSDVNVTAGSSTIGGYQMYTVNLTPYAAGADRILQTEWAGAKYEVGAWSFTGAYYHLSQDFYKTATVTASCSSNAHGNCAGDTQTVSGLIDYTFNKHFDVYAGVAYSDVSGGLSNGFVGALDNTTVVTGMRLKF